MIILEGFDNSGKSTLAQKLGLPVKHAGGPPKDFRQLTTNLEEQLEYCGKPVVLDRVTCISDQVYGNKMFDLHLQAYLKQMLKCKSSVLVYCRPPIEAILNFTDHQVKDHDTAEHLEDIKTNAIRYIDRYDQLMSTIDHIKFDYTKDADNQAFINGLILSQVE